MQTLYRAWPLGQLPAEWQRPEIAQLREEGYSVEDPRDAVALFERKVAEYAGARYGVAVDSCTNALFLSLKYTNRPQTVTIPARTYCSVPNAILQAGYTVRLEDVDWRGSYRLAPLDVHDGATRFTRGMYRGGLHCLSFQLKKRLPIGRGGMILTDDPEAARWLRIAAHDGRHLEVPYEHDRFVPGWHMYMTPEDAARGVLLLDRLPAGNDDTGGAENYTDLRERMPWLPAH